MGGDGMEKSNLDYFFKVLGNEEKYKKRKIAKEVVWR